VADGTTGISSRLRALERTHGRLRKPLSTVTNLVGGRPGVGPAEESGEMMDARRRARVFLESLPPERYPRLVESAAPLSECDDPDAYYAFGLVLLLAGIEAKAARKR
jgi:TetR/AcrR family transcriptional regulator, tetracycline repressor protein